MTTTPDLPDLLPGAAALQLPFDDRGLTAPVTPAEALLALPRLRRHTGAVRWLAGDLVLDLIEGDPSRLHEAWQQIEGLDIDDRPSLMRSVAVAMAIPHPRRRPALSWSHHRAVAGLPAEEQDRWLDEAEQRPLTVAALERAIADEQGEDDDEPELFPPPPPPWHRRHPAAVAALDEVFATDPGAAVVVRADGTWRLLTDTTAPR